MKATGIIRRTDDLGRVVIPREIRRTLGIHEGDPLEIYIDKDGSVMFKKYHPTFSSQMATMLEQLNNELDYVGVENRGDYLRLLAEIKEKIKKIDELL